jgi:hypothetical protein
VGLIHMNGRVYDPLLARFGTPDPMTEDPFSTQGWNRYSYVGNSPLNFTDPSGYCFLGCFWKPIFKAIGKFFKQSWGAILQIGASAICGPPCAALASAFVVGVTSGDLGLAIRAGITALGTALAFHAVGNMTDAVLGVEIGSHAPFGFGTDAHLFNIAGHALVGCASAAMQGGKCGPGALSGAVGSFATPLLRGMGFQRNLVAHAVVGGLASVAAGGNFANGAVTAAFGYLFNEMGSSYERGYECSSWTMYACSQAQAGGEASSTWAAEVFGGAIAAGAYSGYRIARYVRDWLEFQHFLNSGGGSDDFISLYHHGDLSSGVNGSRSLSLSTSSDLSHYGPGSLHRFDIPRRLLNEWESSGVAMRGTDLHAPTGIIRPEIRIYPPGSGQLSRYLVP